MDQKIMKWITGLVVALSLILGYSVRQSITTAFEGGDPTIWGSVIYVAFSIGAVIFVVLAFLYAFVAAFQSTNSM